MNRRRILVTTKNNITYEVVQDQDLEGADQTIVNVDQLIRAITCNSYQWIFVKSPQTIGNFLSGTELHDERDFKRMQFVIADQIVLIEQQDFDHE